MKKIISKFLMLFLLFSSTLLLSGETYEEIMNITRKELKELKINDKSIEVTFKGFELQSTDYNKSNTAFLEAVRLDNKNYLAYFYLGVYEKTVNNNINAAIDYYLKAINANPKSPLAYNNLIITYSEVGNDAKSIETEKKLISLFPDYPEGYYSAARRAFMNKDYNYTVSQAKEAIKKYDNIKKLSYYYITQEMKTIYKMDAQDLLISGYLGLGKVSEAIDYLRDEAYIDMNDNNYPYLDRIIADIINKNEELYKTKNKKEYENNLDNLNSLELLKLLIDVNRDMK